MKHVSKILALAAASLFAAGCVYSLPTDDPIPSIRFDGAGSGHKTLVVMLPGMGDRADTFVRESFESAGQQYGFDTVMVDAHFGYYRERILIPRLHEDVILPAREAGYERIWLLGVSMGGFGSLLYSANHPAQVAGVVLLAPFIGEKYVMDEIAESGGLMQWNPDQSGLPGYEVEVWAWLQEVTATKSATPVILGYGLSDRLAKSYPILLEVLDPSQVYTIEGGHNWKTWRPLWDEIAPKIND